MPFRMGSNERAMPLQTISNSPAAPCPPPTHMVTTAYFTPRERAALAWLESLTRLPERGAPQGEYEALLQHFEPTREAAE